MLNMMRNWCFSGLKHRTLECGPCNRHTRWLYQIHTHRLPWRLLLVSHDHYSSPHTTLTVLFTNIGCKQHVGDMSWVACSRATRDRSCVLVCVITGHTKCQKTCKTLQTRRWPLLISRWSTQAKHQTKHVVVLLSTVATFNSLMPLFATLLMMFDL